MCYRVLGANRYRSYMLKGKKVVLRAIESDDYKRLWEFANDFEVELLSGGDPPRPKSMTEVASFFERLSDDRSTYNFAIARIDAIDTIIGFCGLFNVAHSSRTCELGITIGSRENWNHHFGREAVGTLCDYGFRTLNLRKISLSVSANNERAIRSYEAANFIEEARLRQHIWENGTYVDLVMMSRFGS